MWNINENTIKATEYDVLGELPDPFCLMTAAGSGQRGLGNAERKSIKTANELIMNIAGAGSAQGVETAYAGGKGGANSYRITAGTRGKTLTFMMKLFLPKQAINSVIVSGRHVL